MFTVGGPLQRRFLSFIRMSQEPDIISDTDEFRGRLVKSVTNVQLMGSGDFTGQSEERQLNSFFFM